MTRICSYCDKPMGYKCPKCNVPSEPVSKSDPYPRIFRCLNRHYHGRGVPTHGICDECAEKEKEKVR